MGVGGGDIVRICTRNADALPDQAKQFIKFEFWGVLPVGSVNREGDAGNGAAIDEAECVARLAIDHGDLFAGAEIVDCLFSVGVTHAEGNAAARTTPIKAEDKAGIVRRSTMDMRIHAERPMKAMKCRDDAFNMVETGPPHQ